VAVLGIYLMGAGLLVLGGVLKAVRPAGTARALAEAFPASRVRRWRPAVRTLAGAEAALGAAAIARPDRLLAAAVAVSYLGFTLVVLWTRARGGVLSTCGCFGTPDTPPTVAHAVVNLVVVGGALGVAVAGPSGSLLTVLSGQYLGGVPLVAASALAGVLAYLVMAPLARLTAVRADRPTPRSSPG
jgi:hypothetical protein